MTIDYGNWGGHLLFALMCIVIAIVGIVLARNGDEQRLLQSMLLQGILLAYVAGAVFFQRRNELKLGGVVIAGLLIIHAIWGSSGVNDEPAQDEDQSTP
jgi:4-amino-4-deoxy-L-arabinose transferase-like glycosyltransferase